MSYLALEKSPTLAQLGQNSYSTNENLIEKRKAIYQKTKYFS